MMSAESNSEKSMSYQKKDGLGHAQPSFFWYDNDKDLKVCFLVTRVNYNVVEFWREAGVLFPCILIDLLFYYIMNLLSETN